MRGTIEGHGGWLFKHTGDGVCTTAEMATYAYDQIDQARTALEHPS
jgi:hypothetical protein